MKKEIIKARNASYARYEELNLRKDEANKAAFQYENAYVREFGELIMESFRMKMETVKKRKTIEFCSIFANRGESVDQEALRQYLEEEMAGYSRRLDDMIRDHEDAKKAKRISEAELLKIKRIYHRLVKKIHPDMSPLTRENEELKELWQRLTAAYRCNDLKTMEETEVLINAVLKQLDMGECEILIPDIEERIRELEAEIERIKTTDPYQYRYLLDDDEAVSEKKQELEREISEYEDYGKQLDRMLEELLQKGVTITWRMN